MRALDRKLMRDLRRIWAQTLAIALVLACGVMVLVLANGAQHSLTETRDAFYDRNRFADVFAAATRAPRALIPEIAAIPGVALAEARLTTGAVLNLEGLAEPASGRILSLPASGRVTLNVPLLRAGRMPDPLASDEVVLYEPFALANGLAPGAQFDAVLRGQLRRLTVTGHVLSPEFIYTMGPGSMMPDDRRFGLIWMNEAALAAATDLDGAFNEVTLRLTRGADEAAVIAALDRLLAPYGGAGAYGRDRQNSHAFLESELSQLSAMAVILPPIFLIVSAFLVNMVLGRLIALDRHQIGLMKAVGYSTSTIAAHYLKMSLGIGVLGVLVGWAAGWWLGQQVTALYTDFFRFPWLIYVPEASQFVLSGVLGMLTVVAGALRAVRASVRLAPAVAMSPPAPPLFQRGLLDRLAGLLRLRQTTMMILRSITRWPGRAAITVFGVAASIAVLIASFFSLDAIDVIMDDIFGLTNRQHATLTLSTPRGLEVLDDALALPGVLRAEGAYATPVRLRNGPRARLIGLQTHDPGAILTRLIDADRQLVRPPPRGLMLSDGLAEELGLAEGDLAQIEFLEPPRETIRAPVTTVVRQSMGQSALIGRDELFALMRQSPQINQIHLTLDTEALPAFFAQVKATPAIAGSVLWSDVERQFTSTIDENFSTMALIYTALGMLITIGVVYNAARIQLSERAHDLASLRVLGFTRAEVGYVLVGELMVLTVAAVPLGWAAGYGFAALIIAGISTDVVSVPLVVAPRTFAMAALVVAGTALVSALVVRRRLDRIDIVSALKAKE